MIRKHKNYSRPRKLYDSNRIAEENKLVEKYGLKNKREIWKVQAKVKYYRDRAKQLITADSEAQETFFSKLRAIGLKVNTVSDVLALTKEDLLQRRLTAILVILGLARTPKEARQMVSHRRVVIDKNVVNAPSYLVKVEEEALISLRKSNKPVKAKVEEIAQ